jgi:hypothetical protein
MPQWEYYSDHWEVWDEPLRYRRHLRAYRHPDGYDYNSSGIIQMGGGWIYVYAKPPVRFENIIAMEEHRLERGCGWLEIECIMHEMRDKYGRA